MLKIMTNCIKLKEVLSANKEAPFYVEGLYDDIDFKSSLSRVDFETIAKDIFDQVTYPVE